jgi:hypothetical protein
LIANGSLTVDFATPLGERKLTACSVLWRLGRNLLAIAVKTYGRTDRRNACLFGIS